MHGAGSDDPLVWFEGSGTGSPSYLLTDERGSVIAETNASGTVTTTHQYGPYGEPINSSGARFRYTGQILLPGTELYHYKARVYHPKLGRFLQTDPLSYKDGINWYAYVGNDPMNMVDASGLCGSKIKGASAVGCQVLGRAESTPRFNPAMQIAHKALKDGRLNLNEANAIWRANNDENFEVTVDARKLTVLQTGEFNKKGFASGRIPYSDTSDWAVHGSVTLHRDAKGIVTIAPGAYDFQPHDFRNMKAGIRNVETYLGFYVASLGGTSVGVDYLIKYSGTPNVIK